MAYYTPDLSGLRPEHRVNVDIRTLFKTGQKISFNNVSNPVFESSLTIKTVAPMPVDLVYGTDYTIEPDDIDDSAMSSVLSHDSSFAHRLLKSVTIIRDGLSLTSQLKVNFSYQQLYPLASLSSYSSGGTVEFTPDVLAEMISRITTLESYIDGSGSSYATPTSYPRILEEDINRQSYDNYISEEVHNVNTFDGKRFIRPLCGPFFANVDGPNSPGIRVAKVEGNVPLERNVAYVITGVDHHRTRISDDPSGVYTTIHIIEPYAGDIAVSYHAFGGVVTRSDVELLNDQVQGLVDNASRPLLTEGQLPLTSTVVNLTNRLIRMEDTMRSFTTGANYSDVSSGTSVTHALRTLDAGLHWWTIAKLYTVDGATDITTADRIKFRYALQGAKIQADVSIAVDISQRIPLVIESSSVMNDLNYTLYGQETPTQPIAPQFRIIGDNSTIGSTSGLLLQIGLILPAYQDLLAIEDMSGRESCWKLTQRPDVNNQTLPQDNLILLPSNTVTWDSLSSSAFARTVMMPVQQPYRLWSGDITIDVNGSTTFVGATLPEGFRYEDIKEVEIHYMVHGVSLTKHATSVKLIDNGGVLTGDGVLPATDVAFTLNIDTDGSGVELICSGAAMYLISARYLLVKV